MTEKDDGIALTSTSHPVEKNIFRKLYNYIYFTYFYKILEDIIETIEIERNKND